MPRITVCSDMLKASYYGLTKVEVSSDTEACASCGRDASYAVLVPWTAINDNLASPFHGERTKGESWEGSCLRCLPTGEAWAVMALFDPEV